MITKLKDVEISVISTAFPKRQESVFEYCEGLVTEREAMRLSKNTGFERLRISEDGVTTCDLCLVAAENIFKNVSIDRKEIDGIIFVSQTPDYILPATSHVLQAKLELTNDIIAIDINQGCSGYIYGLNVASMLVSTGQCNQVLLCVGDTISKLTNKNDRATRPIFGDAGSATIIKNSNKDLKFNFSTFGEKYKAIIVNNSSHRKSVRVDFDEYLNLNGMEIMNFTLDEVPSNIEELLKYFKINKADVDFFAMHQANKLILKSLCERLGVNDEKLPFLAKNTGNTSSASIPLVISDVNVKNRILKNVMMCGFGVGLSVATVLADLSSTIILETVSV